MYDMYMYIQTYVHVLRLSILVGPSLSYLKPCLVSQLPMAPIACTPVAFETRKRKKEKKKKRNHVHQSPHHNLLCLLTPKRASTRSGIVPGAKVHTALTHPSAVQSSWSYILFSFSFFRHQPPGPSEIFFWDPVRVLA